MLGIPETKASDVAITSIILIFHHSVSMLFEPGSKFSYVSIYFAIGFDVAYSFLLCVIPRTST